MSKTATRHVGDGNREHRYTAAHDESVTCQLCHQSLDHLTIEERADHYGIHFAEEEPPTSTSSSQSHIRSSTKLVTKIRNATSTSRDKLKEVLPFTDSPKQNMFWHPLNTSEPPSNFTPGLIPLIRGYLSKSHINYTSRAVLCQDGVTFISQELFDAWWGCGYRNFLMACTALMYQQIQPGYFALLDDPDSPPGLRNLQKWLETAWKNGYDPQGAKDFRGKLHGKSSWIGTGDLYVAFVSKGIPVRLMDFARSPARSNRANAVSLTKWLINYFSPAETSAPPPTSAYDVLRAAKPIVISDRMPVIMQHKGHSRLVVGYEVTRHGDINLLIFDPNRRLPEPLREAAKASWRTTSSRSPSGSPVKRTMDQPGPSRKEPPPPLSPHAKHTKNAKRPPVSLAVDGIEEIPPPAKPAKRLRGAQNALDFEDDVIIIDDDDERQTASPSRRSAATKQGSWMGLKSKKNDVIDHHLALRYFRVPAKTLSRHDEYQLLWFPLTDPLTEKERSDRKIVTSDRITA